MNWAGWLFFRASGEFNCICVLERETWHLCKQLRAKGDFVLCIICFHSSVLSKASSPGAFESDVSDENLYPSLPKTWVCVPEGGKSIALNCWMIYFIWFYLSSWGLAVFVCYVGFHGEKHRPCQIRKSTRQKKNHIGKKKKKRNLIQEFSGCEDRQFISLEWMENNSLLSEIPNR